jgi:hypothetical protein
MPWPGANKRGMPLPVIDRRAVTYCRHAIELAEQVRREDDKGRRRYLLDLARNYIAVADQIDPVPPTEPQVFSSIK